MRIWFSIFLLLSAIHCLSVAQQANKEDSLNMVLINQGEEEQIHTLMELSALFMHTDFVKSGNYARQAYEMAKRNNDKEGMALAGNKLGMYFFQTTQYDSASYYYRQSLKIAGKLHDDHIRFNALTGLSWILKNKMQNDSAQQVLMDALGIALSINEPKYLAPVYASLADVMDSKGNPDSALSLHFLAEKQYRKVNDSINMAIILNNMGSVLIRAGKQADALPYFRESIRICRKNHYDETLVLNLNNAANFYAKIDSLDKAYQYLEEALTLEKKNGHQLNMAISYMSIGNILVSMKKYDLAALYLDSSMMICKELSIDYGILLNTINKGNLYNEKGELDKPIQYYRLALEQLAAFPELKYEKSNVLLGLYEVFKKQSKPDSALSRYEQYIQIKDTLRLVDVNEKIALLENKYQHEKQLNQITLLSNKLFQMKANQRLYLLAAVILLFSLFTYLLVRRNRIKNKNLRYQLVITEKEKLASELKSRKKELMVNAMHMARLNEITYAITHKLKLLSCSLSANDKFYLSEIVKELERSAQDNSWEEFETRFENVHQEFYHALNQLYPELTPTEIKICSFIRLNMSSKDIALLTNRSLRTIESTRNNIRKKLQIAPDASLAKYLLSL